MPDFKQEPYPTIQYADPNEQYQNMLKTQYLASEITKAKRVEEDLTAQNEAGKEPGAYNADGTANIGVLTNYLARKGQARSIQPLQKGLAEVDHIKAQASESRAKAAKEEMEKLKLTFENLHSLYSGVSQTDPQLAQQQMYPILRAEASNADILKFTGGSPDEHLVQRLGEMKQAAQNPETMRQFVIRQSMGAKDAQTALERKIQVVDGGDHNDIYSTDGNSLEPLKKLATTPKKMADRSTHITVDASHHAANAFGEALAKHEADAYSSMEELARGAPDAVSELDRMVGMVAGGKVLTGLGVDVKLNTLRAIELAGKLTPADRDILTNTQELQKYLANNALVRTAQLNKAGLGAKTSVRELEMVQAALARGEMEPMAMLRVLLNQRKGVQNSIPGFNARQKDVHNSPDLDPIQRTLASHMIDEIPDHPLMSHLLKAPAAAAPTSPASNKTWPTPKPTVIDALRSSRISQQTFDDVYGPGAAHRAMTGK